MAMEMLHAQDLRLYTSGSPHPHLAGIAVIKAKFACVRFSPFWAMRPNQELALGNKYYGQIIHRKMRLCQRWGVYEVEQDEWKHDVRSPAVEVSDEIRYFTRVSHSRHHSNYVDKGSLPHLASMRSTHHCPAVCKYVSQFRSKSDTCTFGGSCNCILPLGNRSTRTARCDLK